MTLTDLRYLVALAAERHFGRAAEKCHVAQPTLSVAIKKVEDELGVPLFERGPSELRVTPLGERVVEQAQRVLNEAVRVKEIVDQGRDPLAGPLAFGAIYTIAPYLLPRLIPLMHARAPRMPLVLREGFTTKLAEALKSGQTDAIVVALPFEETGVVVAPLYDEPFRVLVPATHPWAKKARIAANALADDQLLLLGAGNCFRDQVLQACPRLSQPAGLQKTMEGSSLETIRHMVASGLGVTVLPSSAADILQTAGALIAVKPFSDPVPARRIALAWRASFPRPPAIDVLRQAILDCALPGTTLVAPLRSAASTEIS